MTGLVSADTDDLASLVASGLRYVTALSSIRADLDHRRSVTAGALGASIPSADGALGRLIDLAVETNAFVQVVEEALRSFDDDLATPEATVWGGVVDLALAEADGRSDGAWDAFEEMVEAIDNGDDLGMSNGELNKVADLLADLEDDELRYVFDALSPEQLVRVFHNVHSSGWWSNDWSPDEEADFYATLARVDEGSLGRITDDEALLAELASVTPTQGYLDLLVAAAAFQAGPTDFPTAAEADRLIRTLLPPNWVAVPIAEGRQAEGNLAILDETNFAIAYETDRGRELPANINGIVDRHGRQWVRASLANYGTPFHEALHNYESGELRSLSGQLEEGVTEYFTRYITNQLDDPTTAVDEAAAIATDRANIYADNLAFATDLAGVVGEDIVAIAYFEGDVEGLKEAYLGASGRDEDDWNSMIEHVKDEDWAAAQLLLFPETA